MQKSKLRTLDNFSDMTKSNENKIQTKFQLDLISLLSAPDLTILFELVCRCKIPYKIQKLEQKCYCIHHNFDKVTLTFLKLDSS